MKNLLSATALLLASTSFGYAEGSLQLFNWGNYTGPKLLEKFEKETGIKVTYDVFDSNEVLETKLLAGGSGYDVVVPTGSFLQRQIQAGAFQKLDVAKLPNIANMWDVVTERTEQYDPDNAYSINYMWGTTGIGVNVGKVTELLGEDAPITSLDLVFKAENMAKLAEWSRLTGLEPPKKSLAASPKLSNKDGNRHLVCGRCADSIVTRPYCKSAIGAPCPN